MREPDRERPGDDAPDDEAPVDETPEPTRLATLQPVGQRIDRQARPPVVWTRFRRQEAPGRVLEVAGLRLLGGPEDGITGAWWDDLRYDDGTPIDDQEMRQLELAVEDAAMSTEWGP